MRWPRSVRRVASPFARARRARKRLRRDAGYLQPGLWVLSNDRLARRWRAGPLPRHLVASKLVTAEHGTTARARAARRGLATARTVARLPISLVRVGRRRGRPRATTAGTYPIATWGADADRAVLVDPDGMTVLHVHHGQAPSPAHLDMRRRFSRHVGAPGFTELDGPALLREEYVVGDLFSESTRSTRIAAFTTLLRGYATLTADQGTGSAADAVERSMALAGRAALPEGLRDLVVARRAELTNAADRWPQTPSHGDLASYNVVLREGGRPVLIDFESLASRPFFYDPMLFVLRETLHGRTDLLEAVAAGELDEPLDALSAGAGLDPGTGDPLDYLLASLLLRAADGIDDPAAFAAVAHRYWPALASARALLPAPSAPAPGESLRSRGSG